MLLKTLKWPLHHKDLKGNYDELIKRISIGSKGKLWVHEEGKEALTPESG